MPLPDVIPLIGLGWSDVLFLLLGGVVLAAAFGVVFGRDIIKSGLCLILTLGALAGIYVMLGAAIVAGAQVLVYIGAVSVLILFAIMLTQSKVAPLKLAFQTQVASAALAAVLLALLFGLAFGSTDWGSTVFTDTPAATGTAPVAAALFGPYLLAFEIASVLILAAVIGGLYLAMEPKGDEVGEELP